MIVLFISIVYWYPIVNLSWYVHTSDVILGSVLSTQACTSTDYITLGVGVNEIALS